MTFALCCGHLLLNGLQKFRLSWRRRHGLFFAQPDFVLQLMVFNSIAWDIVFVLGDFSPQCRRYGRCQVIAISESTWLATVDYWAKCYFGVGMHPMGFRLQRLMTHAG